MEKPLKILSLFDRSGVMCSPWAQAGHETLTVDVAESTHTGKHLTLDLTNAGNRLPDCDVLFAFPPCTHLASSGARWWASKGPTALAEGLHLVQVVRDYVARAQPRIWLIENPVGRISTHWRRPDWLFDPYEFAGFADEPLKEAYTKRTCIWGNLDKPQVSPETPVLGSAMLTIPKGPNRGYLRSITPQGFARAVYYESLQSGLLHLNATDKPARRYNLNREK